MDRAWMQFYDEEKIASAERFEGSAYEQLARICRKYPDRTCIKYFNSSMNFGTFLRLVDNVAANLVSMGFKKGDTLLIAHSNCVSFILMIYAANKTGLICSFVSPDVTAVTIRILALKNNARGLFINDPVKLDLASCLSETSIDKVIIGSIGFFLSPVFSMYLRFRHFKYGGFESVKKNLGLGDKCMVKRIDELINRPETEPEFPKLGADDIAMRFNNGSASGEYAAESFSNRALNAAVRNVKLGFDLDDRSLTVLTAIDDSYSITVAVAIHSMLCLGNAVGVVPGYSTGEFIKAIKKYEASMVIGFPSMFMEIYDNFKSTDKFTRKDLSFIEYAVSVGAAFDPGKRILFNEFLAGHNSRAEIQVMYGLTECLSVCALNPKGHTRSNSLGIPFPDVLVKVVDPKSMMELGVGSKGEICVYSPTALNEIYGDSETTSKILRKHRDGRVWIHTGDIGHMDENGFFFFDYTQKRLAKIEGVTVSLKAVEDVIMNVYGVDDVCVVDYCNTEGRNILVAVVVPIDRYMFDNDKLTELQSRINVECELMLRVALRPSEIEYRASLPKLGLGITDYKTVTLEVTDNHLVTDS